jgi:hypothetical protein
MMLHRSSLGALVAVLLTTVVYAQALNETTYPNLDGRGWPAEAKFDVSHAGYSIGKWINALTQPWSMPKRPLAIRTRSRSDARRFAPDLRYFNQRK